MIDLTPVSFTTCTTFLQEKHNSVWKLSAGKAIECYGNNLMSCSRGNVKDKKDEKNADSGSLVHDVAEESKASVEMRKRGYFSKWSVCTSHLGLRNPLMTTIQGKTSCFVGAIGNYFSQSHHIVLVVQGSQSYISTCKSCHRCDTSYEEVTDTRLRGHGEWLMAGIERQGQCS